MKLRGICLSLAGVLTVAAVCYVGLYSPSRPATAWRVGPHDVQLEVVTSNSIEKPVLEVPRSLLVATGPERRSSVPAVSPVVAGVALSAAFVLGGLWFAGRSR